MLDIRSGTRTRAGEASVERKRTLSASGVTSNMLPDVVTLIACGKRQELSRKPSVRSQERRRLKRT